MAPCQSEGGLARHLARCRPLRSRRPTRLLLSLLRGRIVRGTVIVFDEYLGSPNWRNGEFRAWAEFVKAKGLAYRNLAFSNTPRPH